MPVAFEIECAMLIQPYRQDELRFAYCYRVYLRWRTHRARPCAPLVGLDRVVLESIASEFDIRILESASDATDLLLLASLKPDESISACAGKLKGRVSKWLREALQLSQPTDLVSRGYFACTVGKSTREAVAQYLNHQSEHHGYAERVLPPVFVESYDLSEEDEANISLKHARAVTQFHLVLATSGRQGVFGLQEGRIVSAEWRKLQTRLKAAFIKVSFLPDHVHLALRTHPSVTPANLTVELMNAAQKVVFEHFPEAVVHSRLERLWQPSAYIGSYGNLASPQISKYIHNITGKTDALSLKIDEAESQTLEFER